jgi:hypothetical protein
MLGFQLSHEESDVGEKLALCAVAGQARIDEILSRFEEKLIRIDRALSSFGRGLVRIYGDSIRIYGDSNRICRISIKIRTFLDSKSFDLTSHPQISNRISGIQNNFARDLNRICARILIARQILDMSERILLAI